MSDMKKAAKRKARRMIFALCHESGTYHPFVFKIELNAEKSRKRKYIPETWEIVRFIESTKESGT